MYAVTIWLFQINLLYCKKKKSHQGLYTERNILTIILGNYAYLKLDKKIGAVVCLLHIKLRQFAALGSKVSLSLCSLCVKLTQLLAKAEENKGEKKAGYCNISCELC